MGVPMPNVPPLLMRIYSWLLRLLPFAGGLTKLSINDFTNRNFAGFADLTSARMLNGIKIAVDPSDHDGRILYLFGTNDPKVHHISRALLRQGDRFFDIGANYASIGLQAADRVGCNGQVHLFEPQPHLCEAIRGAISDSKCSNIRLHPVGLLDHDDEMRLARPKNHSGMATLVKYGDQSSWDTITVQVKNIATYLPHLIECAPFGVKIDVEGAEVFLMPWLLRQPTLKFIVFEASHNQQKLWEMVRQSDLVLYGLERTVFAKRVRRIDEFAQMHAYHDLVAVRFQSQGLVPARVGSYELGRIVRGED